MKYMVIGIAKKLQGDEAGAREAFLTVQTLRGEICERRAE